MRDPRLRSGCLNDAHEVVQVEPLLAGMPWQMLMMMTPKVTQDFGVQWQGFWEFHSTCCNRAKGLFSGHICWLCRPVRAL